MPHVPKLFDRCPVFAVFASTGKTTLAANKPRAFVDLHEPTLKDYVEYANRIEAIRTSDKIVLIPTYPGLIEELVRRNVPVTLVYPAATLKDHYLERMRARGNSREYLSGMERAFIPGVERLNRYQDVNRMVIAEESTYLSDLTWFKVIDAAVV